jgi:hypothetical protein
MKRRSKPPPPAVNDAPPTADAGEVAQIKVWLVGISSMIWRRVPVPAAFSLRELHGVMQVAMGWEGIHLYQFCLRAARYGSWEGSASSPDVTLAALRFRKGARFFYEYDLNIPWRHEVRIEERLEPEAEKAFPLCTGGSGACPPEDCVGPESFMAGRDDLLSFDAFEDLETVATILQQVVLEDRPEVLDDQDARSELEGAVDRAKAREEARGRPFSRREVNASFRDGEHHNLMHQQW